MLPVPQLLVRKPDQAPVSLRAGGLLGTAARERCCESLRMADSGYGHESSSERDLGRRKKVPRR